MHSGHVVCMKLTQTGLPRRAVRSIVPPPSCGTTSGGAVSPTWKPLWPASLAAGDPMGAPEPPGTAEGATADGDAGSDATMDGDGATLAVGSTVGAGVGRRPTGSGPTNTKAASTPTATRTPARRPARMVAPVFMRREGTSPERLQRPRRRQNGGRRWA